MARFNKLDFKTAIKTGLIQIRQARQREQNTSCIQRSSVVEALKAGQIDKARVRVESVIRTDITLEIYEYLENFLEILQTRDHLIEREKECPITLVEAVHSIIYASSNVEFTAIHNLYNQFELKYGHNIVKAALDVDGEPAKGRAPTSKANAMLISKIQATVPSPIVVNKFIDRIASEEGISYPGQQQQINVPIATGVQPPFVIEKPLNGMPTMQPATMTPNNEIPALPNVPQPPTVPPFNGINDELASLSSRIGGL